MIQMFNDLLMPQDDYMEYFNLQSYLLKLIETDQTKIINLSLLQMIDPFERYEKGIELLKYAFNLTSDIRCCIIGFYISIMWINNNDDNFFKEQLQLKYNDCNTETKSTIDYLFSYECFFNDKKEDSLKFLTRSLSYKGHVNNLLLYLSFCDKSERSTVVKMARNNIKEFNCVDDISLFIDPDFYISEHITGTTMTFDTFDSLVR